MLTKITFPNHGHGYDFFFVLTWWIINEFENVKSDRYITFSLGGLSNIDQLANVW